MSFIVSNNRIIIKILSRRVFAETRHDFSDVILLPTVLEEASHAGESYRRGEASYQAFLPEERHQQG